MVGWSIHILNARGQLDGYLEQILEQFFSIEARATELHPAVSLDITVCAADVPTAPELCISGGSFSRGRIDLSIDTSQLDLSNRLKADLAKTVYHEFHHVLRWDGPGYGWSLGEALVSEGLAQHFVHQAIACDPEPWENALSLEDLRPFAAMAAKDFDDIGYVHSSWFLSEGAMPRWLGYTLGMEIVRRYIVAYPQSSPVSLAHESAQSFRPFLRCLI